MEAGGYYNGIKGLYQVLTHLGLNPLAPWSTSRVLSSASLPSTPPCCRDNYYRYNPLTAITKLAVAIGKATGGWGVTADNVTTAETFSPG